MLLNLCSLLFSPPQYTPLRLSTPLFSFPPHAQGSRLSLDSTFGKWCLHAHLASPLHVSTPSYRNFLHPSAPIYTCPELSTPLYNALHSSTPLRPLTILDPTRSLSTARSAFLVDPCHQFPKSGVCMLTQRHLTPVYTFLHPSAPLYNPRHIFHLTQGKLQL